MADHSGLGTAHDRDAFVAYVAEMTGEFAVVARRHGLEALGYLLEMAHMEAKAAVRDVQTIGNKKPKIAHS